MFRLISSNVAPGSRFLTFQYRGLINPKIGDIPKGRPYLSRTRSWKGRMIVRFDDASQERSTVAAQAFIWAPLRFLAMAMLSACTLYMYLGHDSFMFSMFGFESESIIETRIRPPGPASPHGLISHHKAAYSGVRQLEIALQEHKEYLYALAKEKQGLPSN
eukprot:PhF_6_TR39099/c0_g2_i1/m.58510